MAAGGGAAPPPPVPPLLPLHSRHCTMAGVAALPEVSPETAAPAGAAQEEDEAAPAARPVRLPLSRVKSLMKADPDVTLASQEAVLLTARATELFVETIAKDTYIYAQRGKRKTLQRKDLDCAIDAIDEFAFLEGTLD